MLQKEKEKERDNPLQRSQEKEWMPPIPPPTFASLAQLIRSSNHIGFFKVVLKFKELALAASDDDGSGALHVAANEGNLEISKFLIAHGANVLKADKDKWTPLHHGM